MNNSYTIDELITGYFEKDFSEAVVLPMPKFSLKHRIKMRGIFRKFEKNKRKNTAGPASNHELSRNNHFTFKQRLIITAIIIVCLAFVTGFVILYVSNSFRGTVHTDNTYLFAVNANDCPSTIEEVYTLSVVPEGYELSETTTMFDSVMTIYKNNCGNQLVFKQMIKEFYNAHINSEGYTLEEISINDCNAVCIERKVEAGVSTLVIWDNKDYILELVGNFTKNEMVDLAISNENCGF